MTNIDYMDVICNIGDDTNIVPHVYTINSDNIDNIMYISGIFSIFKSAIDKLLCLDFHGVADLYNINEKISNLPTCIISYVGRNMNPEGRRIMTQKAIAERILSKQVLFGILVFVKLKKIKHNTNFAGTKRTPIELIYKFNKINKVYFIDDSYSNIESVNSIQNESIISIFHSVNNIKKREEREEENDNNEENKKSKNMLKIIIADIEQYENQNGGKKIDYKIKYHKYFKYYKKNQLI